MYKLYESLKSRDTPPTPEEVQLATNVISSDSVVGQKIFQDMSSKEGPIVAMFERQNKNQVSQ
jgi:hypothetical protein